jgi:transcriptional regulator with XRE-family HTH domain
MALRVGAEAERRRELADFLRTRRERLAPEEVGLPRGTRRRVLGLRREELAQLAGVGLTWYTWLEQGRDIRVSRQVVDSLGRALRLDPTERRHLASLSDPSAQVTELGVVADVPAALQALLDQQGASPAYVMNPRWDVLAWNHAARALFADFPRLPPAQRNMVWLLFTEPALRGLLLDWEEHARVVLGQFRASRERREGDPAFAELVERLRAASPEFRAWWPRHEVRGRFEGRREFEHPTLGRLVLEQFTLRALEDDELRLVLYTPLPEADTTDKLTRLALRSEE